MTEELKPCPLCGSDAKYEQTSQVRGPWSYAGLNAMGITVICTRCGCTIPSGMYQEDVTKRWNRRAE